MLETMNGTYFESWEKVWKLWPRAKRIDCTLRVSSVFKNGHWPGLPDLIFPYQKIPNLVYFEGLGMENLVYFMFILAF
jgi:hypothetical protein